MQWLIMIPCGAFSMDGKIAPLKHICELAEKYNALVFLDECHTNSAHPCV